MKVLLSHRPWGAVIGDPLAARAAPIPPEEIGAPPALIKKDEAGRVEGRGDRVRRRGPFFFKGEAQLLHGPPDRGQTGRRGKRHLQFGKGPVRLLLDQRRERVLVIPRAGHVQGTTPPDAEEAPWQARVLLEQLEIYRSGCRLVEDPSREAGSPEDYPGESGNSAQLPVQCGGQP